MMLPKHARTAIKATQLIQPHLKAGESPARIEALNILIARLKKQNPNLFKD